MRAALLLAALATVPVFAQQPHHHHAAPAGVISLDVYADGGAVHVLTGEARDGRVALHYLRTADGVAWTGPVEVRAGPAPRHLRRGDDAQLAARGDRLYALWGIEGTGYMGSGPFAAAASDDGGQTWAPAGSPSDSRLTTGHGFADLLFDGEDLHAVWLDSRDRAQGLRHARSRDGGASWLANATVARGTCECCWNALYRDNDGVHALFRGKGPRDMEFATFAGDAWRRRGRVGAFGWEFKGCPEAGGRLAGSGGAKHALVWTGAPERIGLYRLSARGGKWSEPQRLGEEDAQHADLAASARALLAVWDSAGEIQYAQSRDDGESWSRPRRLAARSATHPRVAALPAGFLVLWTERAAAGWAMRHLVIAP
ncbi:MAG: hypothetical protein AB7S87_06585 [Burkholderiales bacterium]